MAGGSSKKQSKKQSKHSKGDSVQLKFVDTSTKFGHARFQQQQQQQQGDAVVIGEESCVSPALATLKSSCKWQIGLLVGATVGNRTYVLRLAPTPMENTEDNDDDDDDDDGGDDVWTLADEDAIRQHLDATDEEWVQEHHHQVSKCLPGGLSIVGAYAFGQPRALLVDKLKSMTNVDVALFIPADTVEVECWRTATGEKLKWKVQNTLPKWALIRSSFQLDLHFPLKRSKKGFMSSLRTAVAKQAQRVQSSLFTINGRLISDTDTAPLPTTTGPPALTNAVTATAHSLCSDDLTAKRAPKSSATTHLAHITGTLAVLAYAPPKCSSGAVAMALRHDIAQSLAARIDTIEDILNDDDGGADAVQSIPLPARVAFDVDGVVFTWHAFADESQQDMRSMLSNVIGAVDSTHAPQALEQHAAQPASASASASASTSTSTSTSASQTTSSQAAASADASKAGHARQRDVAEHSGGSGGSMVVVVAGIVVAVVAALVGWFVAVAE
ncbi:hypothetical protein PTSG_05813 [Salpingoeca rosetta]|uniref:Uncharacterized protein n=1 Tax=Salpingoeca rosetta (strain ATCC 50818 / BSB-021) TaxID=946362 RepID=F2UCV4_SALR5|nr:uncharacterized protein PTSG_05813 [Salpingoeca rosetta]EGD74449.1 hypothetical protein PTSG_05813 [Salpingoeca rosetta]|eukprot:XP_004992706.1 hypothetical protein PTSG_05813 [Salpingoeca rosetta]